SIETYFQFINSAMECFLNIQTQYQENFLKILQTCFDAFVEKKCLDEQYSYQLSEINLKNLLRIGFRLSLMRTDIQQSCLLIIRRLLFNVNEDLRDTYDKLMQLFRKVNDFDENLRNKYDPTVVIQDDWLQDYIISIPEDWLKLNQEIYQNLCETHRNNRWIIYIWSRIVCLSLLKVKNENSNEILLKLNEWIQNVKHDVYDANDTLTIIFVIHVFEIIIARSNRSIVSFPNIKCIMNIIIQIRQEQQNRLNVKQVDDFIQSGQQFIQNILSLKGTPSMYQDLMAPSIVHCLFCSMDLAIFLKSLNPQQFKFPLITENIETIVSIQKPNDINIKIDVESKEEFFNQFIQQVNDWIQWFNKFVDIFLYIIEWEKNYNINEATQIFSDLISIRDGSSKTIIQMKIIIERTLKLLKPFSDLRRLCHLFNCLTSFRIIDHNNIQHQIDSKTYIQELKYSQSNNTFMIESKQLGEKIIPINDRQHVQWFLASERQSCIVQIEYRTNRIHDKNILLFSKNNIPIDKYVLNGEFETLRNGQLIIIIDNQQQFDSRNIWYRIQSIDLSVYHLFNGIFNFFYEKYVQQFTQSIKEDQLSQLLDQVYRFIDRLLNGVLHLHEMSAVKTIFCNKNISVREEVKKLFANRSDKTPIDQEIEQVCEWLLVYQLYSHLNIIMHCIQIFDIVPIDSDDELIGHLKTLSANENCTLKEITEAYKILQQRFRYLTSQHLQLIKTVVECLNVVQILKKFNMYSSYGRRRFGELQDKLTTQFQLQERNNMILNSLIMTYALCEPFVIKAKNLEDFIFRLARLPKFEENSVKDIMGKNPLET
ncbi:unnamed protein product, partial [Rotaria sordida]